MNIQEAAAYVGKSPTTIRRYIKDSKLEAILKDNQYDIEPEELERVFGNGQMNKQLDKLIDTLQQQLFEKDQQIAELHRLLALSEANSQKSLEDNQRLLEDLRNKKTFWQRLFRG